jgi:hypothetical protein
MPLSPAPSAALRQPRRRCHRCGGPACLSARLDDSPADQRPLHQLSACGSHFADIVQDLTRRARACALANGHITLEAIDTIHASPDTRTGGRIPSSVTLTTIRVETAPAA